MMMLPHQAKEQTLATLPVADYGYSFGSSWIDASGAVSVDLAGYLPLSSTLNWEDDPLGWATTESAIGAVWEHQAKFDPTSKARAKQQTMRELLEQITGRRRGVSQKGFWSFYAAAVAGIQPLYIVDGQRRVSAIMEEPHRKWSSEAVAVWRSTLSARARADILDAFDRQLFLVENEIFPIDLDAFLIDAVHARVVLTILFSYGACEPSIPSTEFWVHSFMLWTGISPPVPVTTDVLPFTKFRTGDKNVPRYRPRSACHRRGNLDWWTSSRDGKSRPLHHSPSARCLRSERCKRLRRGSDLGRTLCYSGFGQMGGEFRSGQCRP
jgi:hypothetical protein